MPKFAAANDRGGFVAGQDMSDMHAVLPASQDAFQISAGAAIMSKTDS
jgi:hypothetical protein